jgi:DNA-binding NtrC family response regulator
MEDSTDRPNPDVKLQKFALRHMGENHLARDDQTHFDDLLDLLRFSPTEGRIWLDSDRVALTHMSSLGFLREQAITKMGLEDAKAMLTRVGYSEGIKDAVIARKLRTRNSMMDGFLAGPQLHSLHGLCRAEPVRVAGDTETGQYYGEFIWHHCFDATHHLETFGPSKLPVCWMQLGYAIGYTSGFMGRPILYKEVECLAAGDPHCRIVGKSLDEWDPEEIKEERKALQPQLVIKSASGASARNNLIMAGAGQEKPSALDNLVGTSPGFISTCHLVQKVADTTATVLLLGATGVGKGQFARALHQVSNRADEPFIALNCAAIPENLIESELFGVEKGAFTGATEARPGRFERAHKGSLFLDEVGTLSMAAQIKLLRALQEREIERVGDTSTRKVDVRIIAATNMDLQVAVKEGIFREDLLYRLNVFPIHIPPLKERREDIPLLMDHFLKLFSARHEKNITGFSILAVDALYLYDYPGNIRELENLIERAVILAQDNQPIDLGHLFFPEETIDSMLLKLDPTGLIKSNQDIVQEESLLEEVLTRELPIDDIENGLITEAIKRSNGNLSEAARMLGVKRAYISYRIKNRGGTPSH